MTFAGTVAAGALLSVGGMSLASSPRRLHGAALRQQAFQKYLRHHARHGAHTASSSADDGNLVAQLDQYNFERLAPSGVLKGNAQGSAVEQAKRLRIQGPAWQEMTTQPYQAQPPNYTDPFWGNQGAGFSLVGGRITTLAQTGDGTWFAGSADGGVWRSSDQGQNWTPTFDSMPTLSIGSLAVNPTDGSLWVGTGESNTSQDSYAGTGVYRTTDDGASYQLVGSNNPIAGRTVFRLDFAPDGTAYAATNNGLFRMAAGSNTWTEVLAPDTGSFPFYFNQVTSVNVVPGTNGQDVIAAVAWRSFDASTNGFYQSTDGGLTWSKVTLSGAIDAGDIGRTTFAYSADGSKLYAIVQSPAALNGGAISNLMGVFVSSGSPASVAGPWTEIANPTILANSGSANAYGPDSPGAQAWYNQTLAVDPSNPNHVYIGLEEVFQSNNGGATWITAAPYWNYPFTCDATNTCPNTTHPDQHALMIANGRIVSGNDGGVYSRLLSDNEQYGGWRDLNRTLHDLQYYDARAGSLGGGLGIWGGLQDNGSSLTASGFAQQVEPAGGDGFDVIVDPTNANNMVGEYVDGTMYSSTNGGHHFFDFVTPTCAGQAIEGLPGGPRSDCDPAARFVTPMIQDPQTATTWLTGGEFVWITTRGWDTSCTQSSCSWTHVFDTGAGHAVTALASANGGRIIYAGWVGGGGNPGGHFTRGLATNYGGTWHQLSTDNLPNRFPAGLAVDPSNPAHAYVVFNGYSRRWIPGGGAGHVFETANGGRSWTDISGNLPDIACDAIVFEHGQLALATDAGAFTAAAGQGSGTTWSVLGTGLPNAAVDDLTVGPGGYLYAGTHGRGIWRITF
jgi:sugar lactone lactonase YvrE